MENGKNASSDADLSCVVMKNVVTSVYGLAIDVLDVTRPSEPTEAELREAALARLAYGRAVMERLGRRWDGAQAVRDMADTVVSVATEPRRNSMFRSPAGLDAFIGAMESLKKAALG